MYTVQGVGAVVETYGQPPLSPLYAIVARNSDTSHRPVNPGSDPGNDETLEVIALDEISTNRDTTHMIQGMHCTTTQRDSIDSVGCYNCEASDSNPLKSVRHHGEAADSQTSHIAANY